ncbi:MAG TPA: beta-phosphoglucomutase family hydrolase [Thermoleophilia bacterium]|nr:beta-phosphoglucomutase family hydrolase [Thermoleophilia bacterium]
MDDDFERYGRKAMAPASVSIEKNKFDAVIFDLDGVVTQTAAVHAAAWKRLFDAYLAERAARLGASADDGAGGAPDSGTRVPDPSLRSFDLDTDYARYVDGKPRYDGVRDFLASRGIELPWGDPSDAPERETVCGLGNRKNAFFNAEVREHGVQTFPSTVTLIRRLRAAGIRVGLMSSSKNAAMVLDVTGTTDLFEVRVDGVVAADVGLPGKPDPAMYLETARQLGVDAGRSVVVEDALSGVEAGRRGGFGLVIGVDRLGQAAELARAGADVVVGDLAEVSVTV